MDHPRRRCCGSAWVMFTLTDNHEVSETTSKSVFRATPAGSVFFPSKRPEAFANLSRNDADHQWFLVPLGTDLVEPWTITVDIEEQGSPWVNTRVYVAPDVIDERVSPRKPGWARTMALAGHPRA